MNEAHKRFQDWLTAGAEGDPPRDVAVHASVCAGCQRSIDALDLLAGVNTGLASMPAEPIGRERGRLAMAWRLAGATAVLFGAAILGVGVSQLIGMTQAGGPVAQASPTHDQNVLGGTATAQPSPDASPALGETARETLTPLGTPQPTHPHAGATPLPQRTPAPTPLPSSGPTSSGAPSGSPTPTDIPTPTAAPTPTPVPTPGPTVPAAITDLVASPGLNSGEIDLNWSAPADGGSQLTGYELCSGTTQGTWPACVSLGLVTSYTDTGLTAAQGYWYVIRAVNAIGPGANSNEASAIAP